MILDDALAVCPVVAIVRGVTPDEVVAIAEAYYAAGLRGIEVPLNSPAPLESIRRLTEALGDRMVCGAGTVLRADEVDAVAGVGGKIIVSPNTSSEVIGRAAALGLDCAPGFATPTEAFSAIQAGARHLKLFPAGTYGPRHLRQLLDVLPKHVVVWAVGGVGADDMGVWWEAGARAFGLGSSLYRRGQSAAESYEKALEVVSVARSLIRT